MISGNIFRDLLSLLLLDATKYIILPDCQAILVTSLTHTSSATASTGPLHLFTFYYYYLAIFVCE